MDSIIMQNRNVITVRAQRKKWSGLVGLTGLTGLVGWLPVLLCLMMATSSLSAATVCTWSGAANGNWNDAGNWDTLPVAGDDLHFAGSANLTTNNDFPADTSFNSITFDNTAGAFTLAGNRITLTGNIINNDDSLQTINLAMIVMIVNGTTTINSTSTGSITLGGVVSGTGSLTKDGTQTLNLRGANTYSGGTTLNAGITSPTDNTAFGSGTVTCASGTTIGYGLGGNHTLANAIVLTSGTVTFTVPFANGTDLAFTGIISGAGAVQISGDVNSRLLRFTGANTYTGGTTLGSGTDVPLIDIGNSTALGTGTLVVNIPSGVNGGVMTSAAVTVANSITINSGKLLTLGQRSSTPSTFSGVISGAGSLAVISSTYTLSGANTYTGATTVSAGTLNLASGGSLGDTAIAVASGATFAPNPGSGTVSAGTTGAGVLGATLTLASGAIFAQTDAAVGGFNLQQNTGFGSTALTIGGAVLNFNLSSSGADVLATTLAASCSGTNSIGVTTVGPSLTLAGSYNIITALSGLNGGTWQFVGGGTTKGVTAGSNAYLLTLSNTATAVTITVSSPINVWNGTTDTDWNVASNWSALYVPGANTDIQIGNGSGGSNALAPSVTAAGGSCNSITFMTAAAAVGAGTGTLTIGAGGITASVTGSSIACPVALGAAQTWDTDANTLVVSGVISGTGTLTKTGAGALALSGANTLSGGLTLSVGTVNINHATALGTGTFTIAGGTTIDNSSGAAITLTANNAQTWNGDFTFTGSNALNLGTGAVAMGGATRQVTVSGSTLTVGGVIGGSGGLTKLGAGTLTLGGASTYGGATTVSAGTVKLLGNIAPSGSLIHYAFDSVAGTNVPNTGSLGSAADGTLQNAIVVAGKISNALSFTGSSSGVITNNTVSIGNAFTLAAWVSATNANGGYARIITNNYASSAYLGTNNDNPAKFQVIVVAESDFSSVPVDTTGTWHHLAQVWDGTNNRFYYDGVLAAGPISHGVNTTLSSAFGFGCNSGGYNNENWNGKMDDAYVYGRALTPTEILELQAVAPTSNILPSTTALLIASGATFDLGGVTQQVASLADSGGGGGSVTNSVSADATLTISVSSDSTFSGIISDGSTNKIALTKAGSSTQTLTGTNTYTGATTISAGTLQIGNGSTDGSIATSASITDNAVLIYNLASASTYGNVISGTGTLTKTGAGVLTLSGANTFSGGASLNSGTLNINHATALGTGTFTIAGGTTINNSTAGVITMTANNPQTWSGNFTFTGTNELNLGGGAVAMGGATQVTVTGSTLTVGGAISGAGGLTKLGAGTLTLGGTSTYSGATIVSAGILKLNNAPTAPVAGYARWFDASTSANMTLAGSLVNQWNDLSGNAAHATPQTGDGYVHNPTYVANSLNGLGAIHFIGGGNVIDSNNTNLLFARDASIRTTFSVFKGASFLLTDTSVYQFHRPIAPSDSDPANPLWDATYADANIKNGTTYVNGTAVNGTSFAMPTASNNGFNLVALSTTGNVNADGFNRDRTYNSGDQYQAEVIIYNTVLSTPEIEQVERYLNGKWGLGIAGLSGGGVNALPTGTALSIAAGATLDLNGISQQVASLADSGGGGGSVTNNGNADTTLTVSGTSSTFSGVISDGSTNKIALTKADTGTLTLSGASTYTGATTISGGTISVSSLNKVTGGTASSNLGAPASAGNGTIAIGSTATAGTLLYTGTGEITDRVINLAGTTGGGIIDQSGTGLLKFTSALTATGVGVKTLTLQGSTAGTGEINAAIVNDSGTSALTKTGSGTWTLSGTNTYTGATTVSAGTLLVTGVTDTSSSVTVANGAVLGGTGTVAGTIAVSAGGTLAPGTGGATIGNLSTGEVSFASSGVLSVDLVNATPANEKITTTGTFTCTDGTLTVASVASPAPGTVYTIVSATTISGNFFGLSEGATFLQQNRTFQISYLGGQVTLTDMPTTRTWDGGSLTTNNWTDAANWIGDGVPNAGDHLVFAGPVRFDPCVNNFAPATNFASITFDNTASPFVLSGNSITLAGNITNNDADAQAINLPMIISVERFVATTSGNIDLGGVISGAGRLTHAGPNVLTLTGTNLFTAGVKMTGGTVSVSADVNLGDVSGTLITGYGGSGTLRVTGTAFTATTRPVDWGGFGGAIEIADVNNVFTLNQSFAFGLNTYGPGKLVLTGSSSLSGLVIHSGILAIGAGGTIGAITAGDMTNSSALEFNRSDASSFAGIISGTGTVTKLGTGTLTLSGASTYTGTTTISGGTISVSSLNKVTGGTASSNLGAPVSAGNGTIAIGSTATAGILLYTGTGEITDRVINLAGTTGGGIIDQSGTGLLKFTSPFTATGVGVKTLTLQGSTAGTGEINAAIVDSSSATALTKTGSGTWILSGTNTYTGATTISAGTLQIGNGGATGSLSTGSAIVNNATLSFNRTTTITGGVDFANVISGTGAVTQAGSGTVIFAGAQTYTGATTVSAGTLQIGNGGTTGALSTSSAITNNATLAFNRTDTITQGAGFASVISGSGTVIQQGAGGTLVLNGANTYTGTTSVQDGTLSINTILDVSGGASAVGAPTLAANGTIALGSTTTTGTLVYTGTAQNTNRVINLAGTTGGGTIEQAGTGLLRFTSALTATGVGVKMLTLQGSTAGTGEINAAIVDSSSGATALAKSGTGTWTLSGTNAYSGATTVNAGTLLVNGSIATSSAVTVASSAIIGGTGTTSGVTNNGGAIRPGSALTKGTLTVSSADCSGGTNSTVAVRVAGYTTPGTDYDRLTMSGVRTLGGSSILSIDATSLSGAGTATGVIQSGSIVGTFASVQITNNTTGMTMSVVYNATSIDIVVANSPPVLAAIEAGTLAYIENASATAITATTTVADIDNLNLASATVQITGNYQSAEDVLSYVQVGSIVGTWTVGTGTMSLVGSDTLANYQLALRAVSYQNTSNNPSTTVRTVSFIANDGTDPSIAVTRTITITATNDAPVLAAIEGTTLAYIENAAATAITATTTVADVDNVNLASAVVQITGSYQSAEDVLSYVQVGNIVGTWTVGSGTMDLAGSDTLVNYQLALRAVSYLNTSDNPNTSVRTVSFIANDGTTASPAVTRTITITATNDAPVLAAIEGATLAYTENAAATAITATTTVADADHLNLASSTVQITGNYQSAEDVLSYVQVGSIVGTWTVGTGTMSLVGSDTLANYQLALRAVSYQNTSNNPSTTVRTVSFIANDGTDPSLAVTRTITITATNDAPVLAAIEAGTLAYIENAAATAITASTTVVDADHLNLASATVQITGNYQSAEDVLSYVQVGNIVGTWTVGTGTMSLVGVDTLANYQLALRAVSYQNTSNNPSTSVRTVSFIANDGTDPSLAVTRTITLTATNDAPIITLPGGGVSWIEGLVATDVAPAGTITDSDSSNFLSGNLTMNITNALGGEVLSLRNDGTGAGQIGISGATVSYGGAAIGTLSGGNASTPLVLSFTSTNATPAAAQAALRALQFIRSGQVLSPTTRTIQVVANDGQDASVAVTTTVSLVPVDDPPQASASMLITVAELSVDGILIGSDPENGALTWEIVTPPTSGTLTLLNAATGAVRYLPAAGVAGDLTFTARVSDGTTWSSPATITVRITDRLAGVRPLIVSAPPREGVFGAPLTYQVTTQLGALPSGTDLAFQLIGIPSGSTATVTKTSAISATITWTATGTSEQHQQIGLLVSDPVTGISSYQAIQVLWQITAPAGPG